MSTASPDPELLAELFDRAAVVAALDGPQIEAWVSGLFNTFDDDMRGTDFLRHCRDQVDAGQANPAVLALIAAAIAELDDGALGREARDWVAGVDDPPPAMAQIGTSIAAHAWTVEAPFGRSIVVGFDNVHHHEVDEDLRHSMLIELLADGSVGDLQLAGPPHALLEEAEVVGDRVVINEIEPADALLRIATAWPDGSVGVEELGPGFAANQRFVRRRVARQTGAELAILEVVPADVDVRRGLDDLGYAEANDAALSTLRAAVGVIEPVADVGQAHAAWVGTIRGDIGHLSPRERDGLLWLEWADWLGVGIELLRAGAGSPMTGEALVDMVNRCPEVSSTIDKADRDYAIWAFEVAIDLLTDAGAVRDQALTEQGFGALGPSLVRAWSVDSS